MQYTDIFSGKHNEFKGIGGTTFKPPPHAATNTQLHTARKQNQSKKNKKGTMTIDRNCSGINNIPPFYQKVYPSSFSSSPSLH